MTNTFVHSFDESYFIRHNLYMKKLTTKMRRKNENSEKIHFYNLHDKKRKKHFNNILL